MIPGAVAVRLSPEERAVLEAKLRAPTTEQRQVFRARIVLLATEGRSTRSIARGSTSLFAFAKYSSTQLVAGKSLMNFGLKPSQRSSSRWRKASLFDHDHLCYGEPRKLPDSFGSQHGQPVPDFQPPAKVRLTVHDSTAPMGNACL